MSTSKCASVDVEMITGAFYIPKNDHDSTVGYDSHFIDEVVQAIGVADGVDASKYARELMGKAAEMAKKRRYPSPYVDPKQVLLHAYSNSRSSGSCTACIVAVRENVLNAVTVGDSGFLVIRGGKVLYTSPVQYTEFDCPYLMGRTARGPDVAEVLKMQVEAGDVIIVGTDGLFDNLFPEEIEAMVMKVSLEQNNQPKVLAESLAKAALENSLNTSCKTPYAMAAQAAGLVYSGGKSDDITVVAGYVRAYSKAKVHKFCTCCNLSGQYLEFFREKKIYNPRSKYEYYTRILNPQGKLRGL